MLYVRSNIPDGSGDLLLASCAQDMYIRLWRVAKDKDKATPSAVAATTDDDDDENGVDDKGELKLTGNMFQVKDEGRPSHQYTVTLESVLMGEKNVL